ncbi:MAG: hypothetical protein H7A31_02740 [Thermotogae bacterium]|nr:hypothetical protein [Thermotogota bacterium]
MSVSEKTFKDPVKEMLQQYPRIVVIKAAFEILKNGEKLNCKDFETWFYNNLKHNDY